MIQDRYFDSNVDTDDILSLLADWDTEDCMDTQSTFHMRESYYLKTQSHDPDTPTYMEALSGENLEEYFKAMDDEIQSLMRRDTWEIISRNSVADHNMLPGTWFSFPSGHTLSIETGIYRLLALEPLFCALTNGCMVTISGRFSE